MFYIYLIQEYHHIYNNIATDLSKWCHHSCNLIISNCGLHTWYWPSKGPLGGFSCMTTAHVSFVCIFGGTSLGTNLANWWRISNVYTRTQHTSSCKYLFLFYLSHIYSSISIRRFQATIQPSSSRHKLVDQRHSGHYCVYVVSEQLYVLVF